ncbi:GPI ethanolamine phosphate transferase 3 [Zancudomyces culisetae]|uniref:GPI ethanolamine phosphate transferase 3 n=1 Tax=Zancudomyces culisetae TaxID=1213189 RepID=A0A1R1PR68_ZANCU|nr:GPI ethanolamine phosphate transferase 3 [Zancudomyces culisetae]|eukprot:OMH83431.1 GPI ethanolamine phosphate transferase 3 [Zancudomyces culisetae]
MELPNKSTRENNPLNRNTEAAERKLAKNNTSWYDQEYDRVLVLIIDALRIDFAVYNYTNSLQNNINSGGSFASRDGRIRPYRDRLTTIEKLLENNSSQSMLFRFRADPPTTTIQRLKGLTTGQLPTFVDAGSNFGGSAIKEDNWVNQLVSRKEGTKIVFLGDDTWEGVFPEELVNTEIKKRAEESGWVYSRPFPSLDVWDLDSVDDGVISRMAGFIADKKDKAVLEKWRELVVQKSTWKHPDFETVESTKVADEKQDWDVMIGHMLGVDHVGHRRSDKRTLLVVMGDHGMNNWGDHGGIQVGRWTGQYREGI